MLQTILMWTCLLAVLLMGWHLYLVSTYPAHQRHMSRGSRSYRDWIGRYQRHPYHAVSCRGECQYLRGLTKKRFLGSEAPSLPVPSCPRDHCDCKYVHFNDRRDKYRERRTVEGRMEPGRERRRSLGRRATDKEAWPVETWMIGAR